MIVDDFKPVLRNRNFLYLWISQITSQVTINIMNFVFLVRLFEKTGSAISTSFLWVAYSLPAILIGPFASATVDLVDKRKMLIVTNFLQFLTLLLYGLAHKGNVFLLYEVVFIYSLLNQFYVPSESASLPSLIRKEKLTHANSLFFLTQQGSLILGFGVAGILNGLLGFDRTLYVCAFFLFTAFVSTTFLPALTTKNIVPKKFEDAVTRFFGRIAEGYNFIKGQRNVFVPFLLLICFQVAIQIAIIAVPSIAKNLLAIPLNSAAIYMLVPAGIGAIAGALILPKLIARGWRKKKVIDNSLLAVGCLIFALSFIVPLFDYSLRATLSFLSILIIGLGFVGVVVPSQTFLQESTPKELRGRVFGNFWFLVTVVSVIPVVFSGTIIEILGVRILLLILSGLSIFGHFISKKYGDTFLYRT